MEKLRTLVKGPDVKAIAHFLYTRDLTNFKIDAVPSTKASQVSRERALTFFDRFWLDVLDKCKVELPMYARDQQGAIAQFGIETKLDTKAKTGYFRKDEISSLYQAYLEKKHSKHDRNITASSFFQQVNTHFPSFRKYNPKPTRLTVNGEKKTYFTIPPVEELRNDWRLRTKCPDWRFADQDPAF